MALIATDTVDPLITVRDPYGDRGFVRMPSWGPRDSSFCRVADLRPGPTVPQFSGTVDPDNAASVELVDRASGTVIARASVDPSDGTFSFDLIWADPTAVDYGFRFLAPDGFCSQTFPVEDPVWNQFMGNPRVNDSATGSRP